VTSSWRGRETIFIALNDGDQIGVYHQIFLDLAGWSLSLAQRTPKRQDYIRKAIPF
jgi:hypothetical protein